MIGRTAVLWIISVHFLPTASQEYSGESKIQFSSRTLNCCTVCSRQRIISILIRAHDFGCGTAKVSGAEKECSRKRKKGDHLRWLPSATKAHPTAVQCADCSLFAMGVVAML